MAWNLKGAKPLSDSMMTEFTEAYASPGLNEQTHKMHPYLFLMGQLWGACCEYFDKIYQDIITLLFIYYWNIHHNIS